MHVRLQKVVVAAVVVLIGAGCGEGDLFEAVLIDGTRVESLTGNAPEEVLLVFDPAETGACFSAYSTWRHWARQANREMILLLTRPPSDTERNTMRHLGVYEDGVLRRSPSLRTPFQVVRSEHRPPLIREAITEQDADELITLLSDSFLEHRQSP